MGEQATMLGNENINIRHDREMFKEKEQPDWEEGEGFYEHNS